MKWNIDVKVSIGADGELSNKEAKYLKREIERIQSDVTLRAISEISNELRRAVLLKDE